MKYKVNDCLAGEGTVILKICVAIQGDVEIYGLRGIKDPTSLEWYSLPELEHEGIKLTSFNPAEFHDAQVGDLVRAHERTCKILAISGEGILLSRNIGEKHFNPFIQIIDGMAESVGEESPIPEEHRKHMKKHDSMTYQSQAADQWFDRDIMALLNWKLEREG